MTYWLLHDVCAALARSEFESLTFGGNIHRQHTTFAGGGEVWINRETNAVWKVAGDVKKALQSAIANAENNHGLDVDSLVVAEAWVGKNLVMKRGRPRARGRFGKIMKPFSEITIKVRQVGETA